MASFLSVDGELQSLYEIPGPESPRAQGYQPVEIGKPLMIRYLFFLIKWGTEDKKDQERMISSFVKTKEEKPGVAESINYFSPEAFFKGGTFELEDIGGQFYGHELAYYTKSYLGESVRLTTKIMELDNAKEIADPIKSGISTVAGLPMLAPFLSYISLASSGVSIAEKLINLFNRDDTILPGFDLDLHYRLSHERQLQSGRIVCVPKLGAGKEFSEQYRLSPTNRIVSKENGTPLPSRTYFVLQVNSRANKLYENFDYFRDAASLMEQTNRGGDPNEYVNAVVDMLKAHGDFDAMREIEDLALDSDDEGSVRKAKALLKVMSADARRLFQPRFASLFPTPES